MTANTTEHATTYDGIGAYSLNIRLSAILTGQTDPPEIGPLLKPLEIAQSLHHADVATLFLNEYRDS